MQQLKEVKLSEIGQNKAVFLDPRSDHFIYIIYLKIADTYNFVIARKPII